MAARFRFKVNFLIGTFLVAQALCGVLKPSNLENVRADTNEAQQREPIHGSALGNTISRRSTDWSKKIGDGDQETLQEPTHNKSSSEVTTKPPQMVRRIRIHNGAQKIIQGQSGEVQEISPSSRLAENGAKVVRVKKFRRKLKRKTTTVAPEVTTPVYFSSPLPKISTQPGYSHITVVNKEGPKNPKMNRKRKNKVTLNPPQPTITYNSEAKQTFATAFPKTRHPKVLLFSQDPTYPDFGGYFVGRQAVGPGNQQVLLHPDGQQFVAQHRSSPGNLQQFGHVVAWTTQPDKNLLQQRSLNNSPSLREQFPSYYRGPYTSVADQEVKPPPTPERERLTASARGLLAAPENRDSKIQVDSNGQDNNDAVVVGRSGIAATTASPVQSVDPASSSTSQNVTKKDEVVDKLIEVTLPDSGPKAENNRDGRPLQSRKPPQPARPYMRQNDAYFDPFFNTPSIHSTHVRNNRPPVHSLEMHHPMHLPFSSFYSPGDSESEEYIFQPYQSGHLLIPGFHQSPQLRSLRRSFLDEQVDEGTTSMPVTPFSLPKFEMPAIDFNDKGCQTVYKEVKSVPGEKTSRSSEQSAKSFVISRECYFPNGIPSKEEARRGTASTETPKVTQSGTKTDSPATIP